MAGDYGCFRQLSRPNFRVSGQPGSVLGDGQKTDLREANNAASGHTGSDSQPFCSPRRDIPSPEKVTPVAVRGLARNGLGLSSIEGTPASPGVAVAARIPTGAGYFLG